MDWIVAAAIVGSALATIINTVLVWLTRRDMGRLEINTNSKMDVLLARSFGLGETKGRNDEIQRQKE